MEYKSQFEKLYNGFKDARLSDDEAKIYADGGANNMAKLLTGTKPKATKTKMLSNQVKNDLDDLILLPVLS